MHSIRRAVRPRAPMWTIAAIAAVLVGALVLIMMRNGGDEPAEPAAAQLPPASGNSSNSGQAGTATTGGAAAGPQKATEVDRTFLVKVRQAGLWEIPAGRLAQTHSSSEAVMRAGLHLLEGHNQLDQLVREDAEILGVPLPNEATPEQQGWVKQLEKARGAEFDRLFADLLRASHGKIFATIGEVRGATQNDLIRRHARQANQTVLDHMEVLEDTGLVSEETFKDVEKAVTPK